MNLSKITCSTLKISKKLEIRSTNDFNGLSKRIFLDEIIEQSFFSSEFENKRKHDNVVYKKRRQFNNLFVILKMKKRKSSRKTSFFFLNRISFVFSPREKKLLVTSDDYGRDLNQSQNLRRKHKRFEVDLASHEPNVENLRQLGSQLVQEVGNPTIDRKCQDLLGHWEALKSATDERTKKLDESLTYHSWAATLDEENAWMKERLHIMNNPDIGTTLVAVQALQKKHESFENDFAVQKERCQEILQQGQKLIDQVGEKRKDFEKKKQS